jgi:hypothetical protein
MTNFRDDTSLREAEATLAALESLVDWPQGRAFDTVIVMPSSTPTLRDEAIHTLARMPKPIMCLAHGDANTLVVKCQPSADDSFIDLVRKARAEKVWAWLQANAGGISGHPRLLVRGPRTNVLLVDEEVRQWLGNYYILRWNSAMRDPDASERELGATAVIKFTPQSGKQTMAVTNRDSNSR